MEYNVITNLESCYIEIPKLLYYSHIPTLLVSLFFGFFVYFKAKNILGKILLFISVIFSLWLFLNMIVWTSVDSRLIMFAWSFFEILNILLFASCFYFVYTFIFKNKLNDWLKALIGALLLPIVVISPTFFNISKFDAINCEAVQNTYFVNYMFSLEVFFSLMILLTIFVGYKKAEKDFKKQIMYLGVGILLFLISFFVATFIANRTDNFQLEQYGLFGMTFFMGVLAYMIVKFKAFNIKFLGAQALVISLVILIGSQFFFIQSNINRTLTGITLALACGFGWFLIKSVKSEVQRKEELQYMSDRLASANDQLRKMDNTKSEFISIASHQLRTPLTAIKGFLSLLMEGSYGPIDDKQKDVIVKVYTSNERLIALVEDLLNVSRIESGRMEFKLEPFNIEKITQEVVDTFVLRAKENNLYLETKFMESPLPQLMIDGGKVREVISNFVDNALKYTPKGGVTVKISREGANARVTVSDTGIGIPATELPYLFSKFSRGKDTSRLNTGGTGLGLYVGKSMIEANGGKVWAESEGQGRGSRFIIELPIEQSKEILDRWG